MNKKGDEETKTVTHDEASEEGYYRPIKISPAKKKGFACIHMRSEYVHCAVGEFESSSHSYLPVPSGCILLSVWMLLIHGNHFCDQCLPNLYKKESNYAS